MKFHENITALLEEKGVGVRGKTIFINNIPSTLTLAIGVFSKLTGDMIDHELPGYVKTSFQLVVRCQNAQAGEQLITQATEAITLHKETVMTNAHVKYVRPRHYPVSFPLSDGNLLEFSVNFDACYVLV